MTYLLLAILLTQTNTYINIAYKNAIYKTILTIYFKMYLKLQKYKRGKITMSCL